MMVTQYLSQEKTSEEASSLLDKSFYTKSDKWLWPPTNCSIFGGSDEDRTREPSRCERDALPTELQTRG